MLSMAYQRFYNFSPSSYAYTLRFTPHPVSKEVGDNWKVPVVYIMCMTAAGFTGFTALVKTPVWVSITGAVASGIAAGTAISECLDDDCYDCDGSGCITCKPAKSGL